MNPAPSPLRVGLIGANWGATHIEAWRAVPGVEVLSVCTTSQKTAEQVAAANNIPRPRWDVAELLADRDIDIIDVTPRPTVRAPIAIKALEAGKHVLQPLPFALSLAEGAVLRELARKRHLVGMVENLHRHTPTFLQAKQILEEGRLGPLLTIRGYVRSGILLDPPQGYSYSWITDEGSGASALRNFGAHLLHVLVWLCGEITSVAADLATHVPVVRFGDNSTKINHTIDSAAVQLRFAAGAAGSIDVSWCTPASEGFLVDIIGEQARMVIKAEGLGPQKAELLFARRQDKELLPEPVDRRYLSCYSVHETAERSRRLPLAAMCACMASAVREGNLSAAQPSFEEALKVMQIVEACYQSTERRQWLDVETKPAC